MNAAVQMQKEGGSDSTVVVLDDVIPDIPDSTLMFDVGPGIKLPFDVISNNIAVVDEVISEKWHLHCKYKMYLQSSNLKIWNTSAKNGLLQDITRFSSPPSMKLFNCGPPPPLIWAMPESNFLFGGCVCLV